MSAGKSLSFSQNTFLRPPSSRSPSISEEPPPVRLQSTGREYSRRANVYDAVAGRISAGGFMKLNPVTSKYRDTASSSTQTVRPDEVLFRRKNAPVRYEENDFYYAHDTLPPERPLPSSELLVSIHAYAADFYHYATTSLGQQDRQSMDETALIAMGILVEELARESLGKTGDLVLAEGEKAPSDWEDTTTEVWSRQVCVPEQTAVPRDNMNGTISQRRSRRSHSDPDGELADPGNHAEGTTRKGSKRRKITRSRSNTAMSTENGG